jgi:hypothetical protein
MFRLTLAENAKLRRFVFAATSGLTDEPRHVITFVLRLVGVYQEPATDAVIVESVRWFLALPELRGI